MHLAPENSRPRMPARDEHPGSTRVRLRSMRRAEQGLTGGIGMVLAATGGLDRMGRSLRRMQDLCRQATRPRLELSERVALHRRFGELRGELERTASSTEHVGRRLLDGSMERGITYVVQPGGIPPRRVWIAIRDCGPRALGLDPLLGLGSPQDAQLASAAVRQAVQRLQNERRELGQARGQLVEILDGLSRPTMESFIQLHAAAREHLHQSALAMRDGNHDVAGQELVLVGAILDIIASYSQAIAPGQSSNLEQLLGQLKQSTTAATRAAELDPAMEVLRELQHTWQREARRPLVVSGPDGRRRRMTSRGMRAARPVELALEG